MKVTRGGIPVFLWFFRTKKIKKNEIMDLRVIKVGKISNPLYKIYAQLRSGKEILVYASYQNSLQSLETIDYLKRRILEFCKQ